MTRAIISSLLDTDLYKLTMMQCVFHHFPKAQALYRFECRNEQSCGFVEKSLCDQIDALSTLRFQPDELDYLASLDYFKPDFLDFLASFKLNPEYVKVGQANKQLTVEIQGGWLATILYEVPLLATISELWGQHQNCLLEKARTILEQKIAYLKSLPRNEFAITDFGTRRRFSHAWHREILQTLLEQVPSRLSGTSNILFAKELSLPVMGTMAHEYLQACQVLAPDVRESQKFALTTWHKEYQGKLGIALTDTLSFDVFLREFDEDLAHQYAGLRQDSGDPFAWTEKALDWYHAHEIPLEKKTFVYSDQLSFPKAYNLYQRFHQRVHTSFGIGTYLTHDVGHDPIDIVIKINRLNDQPVVKISDSPSKAVCEDKDFLAHLKQHLSIE